MKYHINPETGDVSPCKAKIRCRFGGESGRENHFSSEAEARAAVESVLDSRNPVSSFSKKDVAFARERDAIALAMSQSGLLSRDDKLPAVRTRAEMIEKWFSGDRNQYNVIAGVSQAKGLKSTTRRAVGHLSERFSVAVVDGTLDMKGIKGKGSHIDFLSEDVSVQDIQAGVKPF